MPSYGAGEQVVNKRNLIVPSPDDLHACNILYIPDDINPATIAPVVRQALAIHMVKSPAPVSVIINSTGGDIDVGFNLIEILLGMKRTIVTYALGGAYSAGFLIYLAGDIRIATPRSSFMLHQYSWAVDGKHHELVASRVKQDHMVRVMRDYITMQSSKEAAILMEDKSDRWLTAQQARKVGIVHKIVKRVNIPQVLPVEKESNDKQEEAE